MKAVFSQNEFIKNGDNMTRFDNLITGYSLLLLIGGVVGYVIAGSHASLFMSSISAILLIGSLYLIRIKPSIAYKCIFSLLSLLTLFFAYRWYSNQFMPSGMLCFLTLAVGLLAYAWKKES